MSAVSNSVTDAAAHCRLRTPSRVIKSLPSEVSHGAHLSVSSGAGLRCGTCRCVMVQRALIYDLSAKSHGLQAARSPAPVQTHQNIF
jgi:hypothetical protein